MNAYVSLSRLAPDLLQDGGFVQIVTSRLDDGEESVVHCALEICLRLASVGQNVYGHVARLTSTLGRYIQQRDDH